MRTTWIDRVLLGLVLSGTGWAQVTERVSFASGGQPGTISSFEPSISADGRFVAFASNAIDHVPGDTNNLSDVFVRDRWTDTVERVSVRSSGAQGNGNSISPAISDDGRYVAFQSDASNLVPGDTNGVLDVFVRDRQLGTTERVSVDSIGAEGDDDSQSPSISADGRFVVFDSRATNLVLADTNGDVDVFVHDRQLGTTERVSVDAGGAEGEGWSYGSSISADGRFVAFSSQVSSLVPGDTNSTYDIFVRELQAGTIERVSLTSGGAQCDGAAGGVTFSSEGRYVTFLSSSTDLVPGDTNGVTDVFLRDRANSTTERVSLASNGTQAVGESTAPSISRDGRCVAFTSLASNLVPADTNSWEDIFVRDRLTGTTERVSVDSDGAQADSLSADAEISADGRYVTFASQAFNLVPGVDPFSVHHVYLRDRAYAVFENLCDPGVAGVLGCPCSNPPSGPGRGCDNSSATGGARLAATGIAYFSRDSLVFTTSGEKPSALSIVLQGDQDVTVGLVYGQGVRCVGGSLKRLFVKSASGGSITAPDFGAGDPSVSARSAAKGDVIQPGESRLYLVYYRDPVVLGGCPSASTFNATQSGRVPWSY